MNLFTIPKSRNRLNTSFNLTPISGRYQRGGESPPDGAVGSLRNEADRSRQKSGGVGESAGNLLGLGMHKKYIDIERMKGQDNTYYDTTATRQETSKPDQGVQCYYVAYGLCLRLCTMDWLKL